MPAAGGPALGDLAAEQQPKPLGGAELGGLRVGLQLGEGSRHVGEVKLVERRMGQHGCDSYDPSPPLSL
jgi:hypothetical protein